MTGVWVLLIAVVVALVAGAALRARSGRVREMAPDGGPGDPRLAGLLVDAGVLDGSGPVLLHFSADWCGPCARVRPLVQRLATELPELRHAEVDVAAQPELAEHFSVLSLPTVVVLDAGLAARWRVSGVPEETELVEAVRPLVTR